MKIAIMGTRGIPNRYGGFEQFASYIAPVFVQNGHQVTVYNSSENHYKKESWKGVNIVTKYDPQKILGTAGQFIYDLLCIADARKRNYDLIFQLGYTSSSIWSFLFPRQARIVTNMDGMEWKRDKYNFFEKKFLLWAEKQAVKNSDQLIADSLAIQKYLQKKYNKHARYISYGAIPFEDPDPDIVTAYGVTPFHYDLMIARCVPENHIEMVVKGFLLAHTERKLLVIGIDNSRYAKHLLKNYDHPKIIFKNRFYDTPILNNLRYFSQLYFHCHSAGGTNPSLLEAMACRCLIIAHDNIFNKEVLGKHAHYVKNAQDISLLLNRDLNKQQYAGMLEKNLHKIKQHYNWENIYKQIEQFITESDTKKRSVYSLKTMTC